MKSIIKAVGKVLSSPFAIFYTFAAILALALLTGKRDPLDFVLEKIFPPEASYGVSLTQLSSMTASQAADAGKNHWILLIRPSGGGTHSFELVDYDSQLTDNLAIGSIGGIAVPRRLARDSTYPTIAELTVPAYTVATVLVSAEREGRPDITLLSPTVQKKMPPEGDLQFFSRNEVRSLRITYILIITAAALLGATVPRFTRFGSDSSRPAGRSLILHPSDLS